MAFNLADLFSGGQNSQASDVLKGQLDKLNALPTPNAAQLTLPQLQRYVQAGLMTPEEAQSYLVNNNAYDTVTADNTGMNSELSAIGELQNIINQGGNDAEEQANLQGILNTLGTTEAGQNQAILANNARQGIANSGLTEAAELAGNQNSATNANTNALNEGAAAEARKMAAITGAGQLGGQVQGQEYTAGANRANAANAIAQFNAQQNQQVGNLNTTAENEARAANLATAQDVANKNTASAQAQEESIPAAQQQAYEDALNKATAGMTGAENVATQKTQAGQQNAGILGGLLGTAGTVGAAYLSGNPYAALATQLASSNATPSYTTPNAPNVNVPTGMASGGKVPMNMKAGGPVPGMPKVQGDSPMNDTVDAKLSPGEIVLPRSVTQPQPDPNRVLQFLRSLPKPQAKPAVHPRAVLDTLRALNMHHQGVA